MKARGQRLAAAIAIVAGAVGVTSPEAAGEARVESLQTVSGGTLSAACEASPTPSAGVFCGAEVEPAITVHPGDPDEIITAYQQDRTSGPGSLALAGARSTDRGESFAGFRTPLPTFRQLLSCRPSSAGDLIDRAASTSLATGPDGALYLAAVTVSSARELELPGHPKGTAIEVTVSRDRGATWSSPVCVANEDHEYTPAVAADPKQPGVAYLVWSRKNADGSGDSGIYFASTGDHGASWTAPALVTDPPDVQPTDASEDPVALTPAMTVASLLPLAGNGSCGLGCRGLMIVMTGYPLEDFSGPNELRGRSPIIAITSRNGGTTWGKPEVLATQKTWVPEEVALAPRKVSVPFAGTAAAVSSHGVPHVAWIENESRSSSTVMLARHSGGAWSTTAVRSIPAQGFLPSVAVARDGTVGVTYYDLREDRPEQQDGSRFTARFSLAHSGTPEAAATWDEIQIGQPFDLAQAPALTSGAYIGTATGLAALPHGFAAAFTVANDPKRAATHGKLDIQVARVRVR